ncbi:MAG: hypothetical protein K6F88_02145, partial [Ruminococcus sp.]|nr:hypothetical protein [Ruminococcus sp.]
DTPRAKAETLNGLWALHRGQQIEHPEFTENALLTYLRHHIGFLKEIQSDLLPKTPKKSNWSFGEWFSQLIISHFCGLL